VTRVLVDYSVFVADVVLRFSFNWIHYVGKRLTLATAILNLYGSYVQ